MSGPRPQARAVGSHGKSPALAFPAVGHWGLCSLSVPSFPCQMVPRKGWVRAERLTWAQGNGAVQGHTGWGHASQDDLGPVPSLPWASVSPL